MATVVRGRGLPVVLARDISRSIDIVSEVCEAITTQTITAAATSNTNSPPKKSEPKMKLRSDEDESSTRYQIDTAVKFQDAEETPLGAPNYGTTHGAPRVRSRVANSDIFVAAT